MNLADEMGYSFPSHVDDHGVQGQYFASHAELKPAVAAPNVPVGQSNIGGMCNSCQNFYRTLANYRGEVQVVASPSSVSMFYPNGSIIVQLRLPGF